MSYPGNSSLAPEIQERILSTFSQTLDLASQGSRQEALLGCDFVLRMDPLFEPARSLQKRLETGEGAVSVDDLRVEEAPGEREESAAEQAPEPEPVVEEPTVEAEASPGDELRPPDPQPEALEPQSLAEPAAADSDLGAAPEEPEAVPADFQTPETPAAPPSEPDLPEAGEVADSASAVEADTSQLEAALDLSSLMDDTEQPPEESETEPVTAAETGAPADPGVPEEPAVPTEPAAPAEPTVSAEPAAKLDTESEKRIEELLAGGQAAFERNEYQSAIDAWSRIFLIDIDHPEANRRIELARKLKAEVERRVEEIYHEALSQLESGKLEGARKHFAKVIEMQPGHLAAQEYLDRLSSGDFTPGQEAPEAPPTDEAEILVPPPPPPPADESAVEPELEITDDFDLEPEPVPAKPKPRRGGRGVLAIAGGVLVVVAIAGWFLYQNWDRAFPNTTEELAQPSTSTIDPIARATTLHNEGSTSMAIAQLRRLPPAHPQYAEAQTLIAQWEAATATEPEDGPTPEQLAERDRLVSQAREAFANRQFLAAQELFSLAGQSAPLDEGAAALQTETAARLQPLNSEIEIVRQGEWGYALRSLWRKHEEDPGNPDIRRLMVDSYYNLAVRDLQRGDPAEAEQSLLEADQLSPNDPELQRLLSFARIYKERQEDLLYRIFVKYLPFR
jgi:tetratricopeptide (TPR) repeat protein